MGVQNGLQQVDFGSVRGSGGESCGGPFETFAQIVKLGDGAKVMLGDGKASPGSVNEHAVGLQPAKGFADRGPAHLEPGAQVEFRHALARFDFALLDRIADGLIRLATEPTGRTETRAG